MLRLSKEGHLYCDGCLAKNRQGNINPGWIETLEGHLRRTEECGWSDCRAKNYHTTLQDLQTLFDVGIVMGDGARGQNLTGKYTSKEPYYTILDVVKALGQVDT